MILGHDVSALLLCQGLEHTGLRHQDPGVEAMLQHTGVRLLGQREVQDRQLVSWQTRLLLRVSQPGGGEYSVTTNTEQ